MMLSLTGGRVLCADGSIEETSVMLEGGQIGKVGEAASRSKGAWDVSGHLVLPAIIDLHGDAFERQIMPRPGVQFPLELALMDTDRQMTANGISTAYHGITYSWEPGLRGRDNAVSLIEALNEIRDRLSCDTRVHLRYETYNTEGVEDVARWIEMGDIDLLAFNDHMPHIMDSLRSPMKVSKYTDRTGLIDDVFVALAKEVQSRKGDIPANLKRLAELAHTFDIPCASHDDPTPDVRKDFHDMGVGICEFPVDEATAAFAQSHKDPVIMGGPNVLRGGSHCGQMCATDAVRQGLCTVLTSDYYYPSLLQAPFKLVQDGVCDFQTAWALVSTNPAKAAGLSDRGEIGEGKRADLVVVDDSIPHCPRVIATFVAGRPVHIGDAGYRMCA